MTQVGALVFGLVSVDATVAQLLGSGPCRFYPNHLRQGTDYPAATYQVITDTPQPSLDGYTSKLRKVRMQVDVYSTDYQQAQDVADAVTVVLGRYTASTYKTRINLRRDLWEAQGGNGLHRVLLDFMMWVVDPE